MTRVVRRTDLSSILGDGMARTPGLEEFSWTLKWLDLGFHASDKESGRGDQDASLKILHKHDHMGHFVNYRLPPPCTNISNLWLLPTCHSCILT